MLDFSVLGQTRARRAFAQRPHFLPTSAWCRILGNPSHDPLVNYGTRCHVQLPISTAFLESAVNEILSKRMIKKQQMRRNRLTVRPFLDVRVAVLNKTLAGSFRRLYPDFQSDNESYSARLAA